MYNCTRKTNVLPVHRRCRLSILSAYPSPWLHGASPSCQAHHDKPVFCPSRLDQTSLGTPVVTASTPKYNIDSVYRCLPRHSAMDCPPATHTSSQVHDKLPIQETSSVPKIPSSQTRNRDLLNTMFKFKKNAPLQEFIHGQTKVNKKYYSLAEILTILKDTISSEKMFDERNPSVIICSQSLETALNQRALHVTEVRDLVITQLERLSDQSLRDNQPSPTIKSSQQRSQVAQGVLQTAPPITVRTASIATNVQIHKDSKFLLKPLFLKVLRTVDGVRPTQIVFTYEEITNLLSKYILSKREAIFDKRNIKLALVENDPLGKAFGVTAFHRCQVNSLLRTQLIPFHSDCSQHSTTTNSAQFSRVAILL